MRRANYAFTLIEVLMVIAIISLLAGIIYAACAPVRAQARIRVCVSNLKQCATAIAMYQSDNDGTDPIDKTKMQYWQLGLPPNPFLAITLYTKNKDILFCPDYHGNFPVAKLATTYDIKELADNDPNLPKAYWFSEVIQKRGVETPLITCIQHNPVMKPQEQPQWAKKKVIVLRLNHQVDVHQVPFLTPQYDW